MERRLMSYKLFKMQFEDCLQLQIDEQPTQTNSTDQFIINIYEKTIQSSQKDQLKPDIYFLTDDSNSKNESSLDIDLKIYDHLVSKAQKEPFSRGNGKFTRRLRQSQVSPFKNAKQIAVKSNHKLWGYSLYPRDISQNQIEQFVYISTTCASTAKRESIITTYLNNEKCLLFRIQINSSNLISREIWSYLSVYHHTMPCIDIYSLMQCWTEEQIYAFWLVRSYAIQAMLFRLEVIWIDPIIEIRYRYWHSFDAMEIKVKNYEILREFSEAGVWKNRKQRYDFRLASHNEVNWEYHHFGWNMEAHHFLELYSNKRSNYAAGELTKWHKVIKKLYYDFIDRHRVNLQTYKMHYNRRDKIVFEQNRTYFDFKGNMQKWNFQPSLEDKTIFSQNETSNNIFYFSIQNDEQQQMKQWFAQLQQLEREPVIF